MSKIHQIFVGCPFAKSVRKNYDRLKRELEKETPLHLVLADTAAVSSGQSSRTYKVGTGSSTRHMAVSKINCLSGSLPNCRT